MRDTKALQNFIVQTLQKAPKDWLQLTTHRLDIYNETLAKTEFLDAFTRIYTNKSCSAEALQDLPTAYDYIRLGHPLSCILEWYIAQLGATSAENVISFSSKTAPILAILRTNHLENKNTRIIYSGVLPKYFDAGLLRRVYGYRFELQQAKNHDAQTEFKGSTIYISDTLDFTETQSPKNTDFTVHLLEDLGSIVQIHGTENEAYIATIQHVRRRETIAMTPQNCLSSLHLLTGSAISEHHAPVIQQHTTTVQEIVKKITNTSAVPLLGSSGLSIQYAIMMGLVDHALTAHVGKQIKFVVPPNCYGGTNDQARRVAACLPNVTIVDLPVDGDNDMVKSIASVLETIASQDAIAYIIAEIPTNPRVEVPDLEQLKHVLNAARTTRNGHKAIAPVFILDQTFCPNVHFLGDNDILSGVAAISYASGSKFPSGGLCTAGYCTTNTKGAALLAPIAKHLKLADNEATAQQVKILATQLPSMNARIATAYKNTREVVDFIAENLPTAKLNFVSETLAKEGFTPSVFSLDLPTKGKTKEEKEQYKRTLNHSLITLMITQIPEESKHCVSYGQLKGCYWTVPATSTQGTTKEGDKDYIVRVSCGAEMDVAQHKTIFLQFLKTL